MARHGNKSAQTIYDDRTINPRVNSEGLVGLNTGYASFADQGEDGHYALSLIISGVHCAGCIQKIESRLYTEPDIDSARLNFSTGRLKISWRGGRERADNFVAMIESLGYGVDPFDVAKGEESDARMERHLLLCLGVAGFAMGNIMLLSVGVWSSSLETMGVNTRDLMHWVMALIALPVVAFSGRPFFSSAFKALSAGHTNMDVPISLALILACAMSVVETLSSGEHVYFDSAVMLMFFLLIGRYLDFKARHKARSAALGLMKTISTFANVLDENSIARRVAVRDLRADMRVVVASGEKFPVDGVVLTGQSSVDTSLVTGETLPQAIRRDDQVYAGTLNIDAPVTVKVSKAAEDSLFADIIRLMEQAEQGQAEYVRLADRAAKLYTPFVHLLALAAFILWFAILGIGWQPALLVAVTVLIITCPCALGLAVPVVQVLASGLLMRRGVLLKSGDALERLAKIDHVVFDKTGTLTHGAPRLIGQYDDNDLKLAASLAHHSAHPLSRALYQAALDRDDQLFTVDDVEEVSGQGVQGRYNGRAIRLGNAEFCGADADDKNDNAQAHMQIWMRAADQLVGPFQFEDSLREDVPEIVAALASERLKIELLSGDREAVVKRAAKEANISHMQGGLKPNDKYDAILAYQAAGGHVLMVGDGLNDAPVLAAASVSMAPGTAIDVAQNAADIVFMGKDLSPVYNTYKIAKFTQLLVKQNFALAIIYNIIAVPLAFLGLVTPIVAALAMSGSSLLVILNSFRLRWKFTSDKVR